MRIRTLWENDPKDDDVMPWLVAAVDEYTEEEHNGTPEFYQKELDQNKGCRRELIITIKDGAVLKLFQPPTVDGEIS